MSREPPNAMLGQDSDVSAQRIESELEGLRDLFAKNLSARLQKIDATLNTEPNRSHAVGLLYAGSGLYTRAQRTFSKAIFGKEHLPTIPEARRLLSSVTAGSREAVVSVLGNLALCLTLSAHSNSELLTAAGFTQLALDQHPKIALVERGELMLWLALTQRLQGNLSAEKDWLRQAISADASL